MSTIKIGIAFLYTFYSKFHFSLTYFQTLESAQRKKDISQALTTNMSDIFSFIIQLITCHVDLFKKAGNLDIANDHYRVVQVQGQ